MKHLLPTCVGLACGISFSSIVSAMPTASTPSSMAPATAVLQVQGLPQPYTIEFNTVSMRHSGANVDVQGDVVLTVTATR